MEAAEKNVTLHNAILVQTLCIKVLHFRYTYLRTGFQCIKFSTASVDEFRFCSRASRQLFCSFTEEASVQVKQKMKTLMFSKTIRNTFFPAKADLSYKNIKN